MIVCCPVSMCRYNKEGDCNNAETVRFVAANTQYDEYGNRELKCETFEPDPECGNLGTCSDLKQYTSYCYKDCEHRGTVSKGEE